MEKEEGKKLQRAGQYLGRSSADRTVAIEIVKPCISSSKMLQVCFYILGVGCWQKSLPYDTTKFYVDFEDVLEGVTCTHTGDMGAPWVSTIASSTWTAIDKVLGTAHKWSRFLKSSWDWEIYHSLKLLKQALLLALSINMSWDLWLEDSDAPCREKGVEKKMLPSVCVEVQIHASDLLHSERWVSLFFTVSLESEAVFMERDLKIDWKGVHHQASASDSDACIESLQKSEKLSPKI